MQVRLERSGGFAGIRVNRSVSSDELPPDQRDHLEKLVQSADLAKLPAELRAPKPDRFQYRLTVDSTQGCHSVLVDEAAVPDSLRPLLDWMNTNAPRK